jgi:hypothetical protein
MTLKEEIKKNIKIISTSYKIPSYEEIYVFRSNDISITKNYVYIIESDKIFQLDEFQNEYIKILNSGYSWINIAIYGIRKAILYVCIETPKEPTGVPQEFVRINYCSPPLKPDEKSLSWNIEKYLKIK